METESVPAKPQGEEGTAVPKENRLCHELKRNREYRAGEAGDVRSTSCSHFTSEGSGTFFKFKIHRHYFNMKIQVSGFSQKSRIPENAEPTFPHGNHWLELRARPLYSPLYRSPIQAGDLSPAVLPWPLGGPCFNTSVYIVCLGKGSSYFRLTLQGGRGDCPLHLPHTQKKDQLSCRTQLLSSLYICLGVQWQPPCQYPVLLCRTRCPHSWFIPDVV